MLFATQLNRPLRIDTPLGPDRLLLVAVEGTEAISELFDFRLQLLAPLGLPIEFEKLLGKPISLVIETNAIERRLHGIAVEFSQGRCDEEFTHYELRLVPKLWWLTQHIGCRVFQQQDVPAILQTVLQGIETRFELAESYPRRNYCVQYRESDYAFACRLMEEEGIHFHFEFDDTLHTLVVADSNLRLPEISSPNPIVFEDLEGGSRDDLRINRWAKQQRVQPAKVTLWDHHFELPAQNLRAEELTQQEVQVGEVTHTLACEEQEPEVYDYPGGYAKRFDGVAPGGEERADDLPRVFDDNQRSAKLRMQQLASPTIEIAGESNCPNLTAGHRFVLTRHEHGNGDYVLRRIEHRAELKLGYRAEEDRAELQYSNRFTAGPLDLPYRPSRTTPRPRIAGTQTATVVGPPNAEVFVDKYGRIKVQFHWDREGGHNADSSCWVRVAQLWAGNRWGSYFWPRIGHEVVVSFSEGDPDRPLVIGSVYNAANMPPFELPRLAQIGGIKSCIFGGDSMVNFNAIQFHDATGEEYLHMHSERDELHHNESNRFSYVPKGSFSFHGKLF
jgi:type VI secretion system secreted protein VgrG